MFEDIDKSAAFDLHLHPRAREQQESNARMRGVSLGGIQLI